MFNIGFAELILILLVAFLVVGPKDLPRVARWLGRMIRDARRMFTEFQKEVGWDDTVKELQGTVKDLQDTQRDVEKTLKEADPTRELNDAKRQFEQALKQSKEATFAKEKTGEKSEEKTEQTTEQKAEKTDSKTESSK